MYFCCVHVTVGRFRFTRFPPKLKIFWVFFFFRSHDSRLRLERLGAGQVVTGHNPGVQDAAVGVDLPHGPPVPAAAQDAEQVPLPERQLVRVPGLEPPDGRVDGAALPRTVLRRTRWSPLTGPVAPAASFSSRSILLAAENPLP